jgi:hypothetical protein
VMYVPVHKGRIGEWLPDKQTHSYWTAGLEWLPKRVSQLPQYPCDVYIFAVEKSLLLRNGPAIRNITVILLSGGKDKCKATNCLTMLLR